MPGRDKTGPQGQGERTGRGMGNCQGDGSFQGEGQNPNAVFGLGRGGRPWGCGRGRCHGGRGYGRAAYRNIPQVTT